MIHNKNGLLRATFIVVMNIYGKTLWKLQMCEIRSWSGQRYLNNYDM